MEIGTGLIVSGGNGVSQTEHCTASTEFMKVQAMQFFSVYISSYFTSSAAAWFSSVRAASALTSSVTALLSSVLAVSSKADVSFTSS